jgi:protein-tyrosine phosphatase
MIDIHSHVLPGVDDGSKSLEESVEICRRSALSGTRILFATPHIDTPQQFESFAPNLDLLEGLQREINKLGIEITLMSGAEIFPSQHLIGAIDAGVPITLANRSGHVLLGLPMSSIPLDFEHVAFELQARGLSVILAHPERLIPIQQDPSILHNWVTKGMLLQVNAGSLSGRYGHDAEVTAWVLLEHNWVHFVASDAHSSRGAHSLASAVQRLKNRIPDEDIERLTVKNGECVVDGLQVPSNPLDFSPTKRKTLWSRIWNR